MKSFDHLILIGRPACGKSEFIDFMKNISDEERLEKFHIGKVDEIDDFPWIYEKFMEDNMWQSIGKPRLYSKQVAEKIYDTTDFALYDFMMAKFNSEIEKRYINNPEFYKDHSLFVEFARGQEDAYKKAFSILSKDILERAAIINIFVSFEESCRRNIARSTEKNEQGILHHRVPDEVIEGYYRTNDWREFTNNEDSGFIDTGDVKVPFVTMHNEPELKPGAELSERYKTALDRLFELYAK